MKRPWLKGNKYRVGKVPWNKGKRGVQVVSKETRLKLSLVRRGNTNGFKKGSNNLNWVDGKSKEKNSNGFYVERRRALNRGVGGSHTLADWETLKAQYNWTCPACRKSEPEIKLTLDHVIPVSKGGSHNIENIQPLCKSCNSKKHTKTIQYEYK